MPKESMSFSSPLPCHLPQLRQLWKETFGDSDAFLDMFKETAFSFRRCRCAILHETVIAALYWFDCIYMDNSFAYLYAIATKKEYRKQGICHALMEHTHQYLKDQNYVTTILVPATEHLFGFYQKMGYQTCIYRKKIDISINSLFYDNPHTLSIRKISKEEFAFLRRLFLPKGGILQEKENLDFLERQAEFFTGTNTQSSCMCFLLTAYKNDSHLEALEFLGDENCIPFILSTFKCDSGTFYMAGNEIPVGMCYPLKKLSVYPNYLGFPFE